MTLHILPAGTDVAEMALFAIDAVPVHDRPNAKSIAQLALAEQLVQMPTGGDGDYLLHLYVDEAIPSTVKQYCCADDRLKGRFRSGSGAVAFGGTESAYKDFKPNPNIRSDAQLSAGDYLYTAFHTDLPDELVTAAVEEVLSTMDEWLPALPPLMFFAGAVAAATASALAGPLWAIAGFALTWLSIRTVVRSPRYRALKVLSSERQLQFPSIVIELRSILVEEASVPDAMPGTAQHAAG